MLVPKKVKHRKWHKGRSRKRTTETRGTEVNFGSFGMKAEGKIWLSSRQIESVRRVLARYLEKSGKLWIRIFPDKPVTKKGAEVPLGGGKGAVDHYVFAVKPGRILFEIDGIPEQSAKNAIKQAGYKLPIRVSFVKR